MKKIVLNTIVACAMALNFASCTPDKERPQIFSGIDNANAQLEAKYRLEKENVEKNKRITESKEIPVGKENFDKLVKFIEKKGEQPEEFNYKYSTFTKVPGKYEYRLRGPSKDRESMFNIEITDSTGNVSKIGKVKEIHVYIFKHFITSKVGGTKKSPNLTVIDSAGYLSSYDITPEKITGYTETDGTWKDGDEAVESYTAFVKKVLK